MSDDTIVLPRDALRFRDAVAADVPALVDLVTSAYRAAGQSDRLTLSRSERSPAVDIAVDWLLEDGR